MLKFLGRLNPFKSNGKNGLEPHLKESFYEWKKNHDEEIIEQEKNTNEIKFNIFNPEIYANKQHKDDFLNEKEKNDYIE